MDAGQFQNVQDDCERLDDRGLNEAHPVRNRHDVAVGHNRVVAEEAGHLRPAHEYRADAVVVMPRSAKFAMAAGDSRFHRYSLAGSNTLHSLAYGDNLPGGLMSQHLRVDGGHRSDSALLIPMHVTAANPNGAESHKDLACRWVGSHRHLARFESSMGYQLNGIHHRE